jgi:hypothetical protein
MAWGLLASLSSYRVVENMAAIACYLGYIPEMLDLATNRKLHEAQYLIDITLGQAWSYLSLNSTMLPTHDHLRKGHHQRVRAPMPIPS